MRIPDKYLSRQTVRVIEREAPTAVPSPVKPVTADNKALLAEIASLRMQLAAKTDRAPVAYDFTFIRNSENLLEKVIATPKP